MILVLLLNLKARLKVPVTTRNVWKLSVQRVTESDVMMLLLRPRIHRLNNIVSIVRIVLSVSCCGGGGGDTRW